jgi:hypothetical protein
VYCLTCTGAAATDSNIPSNEDLRHVRALINPRISPDGSRALVEIADATADGGRSHLFLVDIAANASRQITWSPENDKRGEHGGRWLGGGSVLFLAKRTEHTQLYRLPMSGGEAHAYDLKVAPPVDASLATDALPPRKPGESRPEPVALDVDDFEPAPDGRTIAVLARDPETPGKKKAEGGEGGRALD